MNNKIKIISCCILSILLIIFVYFNNNVNLEIFKNTKINENKKISSILKNLNYGNDFEFETIESTLKITYNCDSHVYYKLEENASILFYLINDVKEIIFIINENEYNFKLSNILKLYNNFDNTNIISIKKRYKNDDFKTLYLGNINGNIDIFDLSELCLDNKNEIYSDEDYIYYITCSEIDKVIVKTKNKEYKLLDALENNLIDINDLFDTNIKITKEEKQDENISE